MIGKAVILEDVIENIEIFDSNYYQKKIMVAITGKNSDRY
jgi:hypothetical protein